MPVKPVLCRAARATPLGRVRDPELSGLVRGPKSPKALFAIEDSGAPPLLTALRPDGTVLGHAVVPGAGNTDWEDIAAGPGPDGAPALFLADIGDNAAKRAFVQIYRVPEPEPDPAATSTAPATRIDLVYPDGAHDAEALLAAPIRRELVIVTKRVTGAGAYVVPADLLPGRTRRSGAAPTSGSGRSPPGPSAPTAGSSPSGPTAP